MIARFRLGKRLRCLLRDDRGMAAVEFAIVAPTFLMMLFGMLDLGHMIYLKSVLDGAVEAASRSSALETADTTVADQMVARMVAPVAPGIAITSNRVSYFDFSDIGRPERWTDTNGNDTCDADETFVDENRSGEWEADVGVVGNGSANDVVVYRVEARFAPVFRIPFTPDTWNERRLTSTAVRKNQPFSLQRTLGTSTGICNNA